MDRDHPTVYRIRVRGHLDDRWADRRGALSITHVVGGDTDLTLEVMDQAALHGLLRSLRDVGVPLVSINPARSGQAGASPRKENR